LNTSDFPAFVVARVPAGGIGLVSFLQPAAKSTHISVAESTRNMIVLVFGSFITSPLEDGITVLLSYQEWKTRLKRFATVERKGLLSLKNLSLWKSSRK
jgi:hypothetical protein